MKDARSVLMSLWRFLRPVLKYFFGEKAGDLFPSLIGVATVFFVYQTGLIDAKRERLDAHAANLKEEVRELGVERQKVSAERDRLKSEVDELNRLRGATALLMDLQNNEPGVTFASLKGDATRIQAKIKVDVMSMNPTGSHDPDNIRFSWGNMSIVAGTGPTETYRSQRLKPLIEKLSSIPNLEQVLVYNAELSINELEALRDFPGLRLVGFYGCRIPHGLAEALMEARNLEALAIIESELGGVEDFALIRSLRAVGMSGVSGPVGEVLQGLSHVKLDTLIAESLELDDSTVAKCEFGSVTVLVLSDPLITIETLQRVVSSAPRLRLIGLWAELAKDFKDDVGEKYQVTALDRRILVDFGDGFDSWLGKRRIAKRLSEEKK